MAKQARKTHDTDQIDVAPIKLPESVETCSIAFRIDAEEFDLKRAQEALENRGTIVALEKRKAIRAAFALGDDTSHGHLDIDVLPEGKAIEVEFDLMTGGHSTGDTELLSYVACIEAIGAAITNPARERKVVSTAMLEFSLDEFVPVVPLPFSAGAVIGTFPGTPQITGLDLSFSESSEQLPLQRASIATFGERMVLRMLYVYTSPWDKGILDRLFSLIRTYVPSFVRVKPSQGGPET